MQTRRGRAHDPGARADEGALRRQGLVSGPCDVSPLRAPTGGWSGEGRGVRAWRTGSRIIGTFLAARPHSPLKKSSEGDCWGGSCTATPEIAEKTGVAVQLPPQHAAARPHPNPLPAGRGDFLLSLHCPLPTVPCPLSTAHCPLSTVPCPLSTVHCPLSTVPCPLSTVHCPLSTVHCPLPALRYPIGNGRRLVPWRTPQRDRGKQRPAGLAGQRRRTFQPAIDDRRVPIELAQHQPRKVGHVQPQVAAAEPLRRGSDALPAKLQLELLPFHAAGPGRAGAAGRAAAARRSNSPHSRRNNSSGSSSRIMYTSPCSAARGGPQPPASSKTSNSGHDGGA